MRRGVARALPIARIGPTPAPPDRRQGRGRIVELRRDHPSGVRVRLRHQLERERVTDPPLALGHLSVLGASRPDRAQGTSARSSRPTNAGSGAARWSCGRWTWWAGCSSTTAPSARSSPESTTTPASASVRAVMVRATGRAGLRVLRPGARAPRRARRDPHRQRQGLHQPLRARPRPKSSSTRSAGRTASPTASPHRPRRRRPARSSASIAPCARVLGRADLLLPARRPKMSSTPGWATTTPSVRTRAWAWPRRPNASTCDGDACAPSSPPTSVVVREDRSGDDWISRTVSVNGVTSVANQTFTVGRAPGRPRRRRPGPPHLLGDLGRPRTGQDRDANFEGGGAQEEGRKALEHRIGCHASGVTDSSIITRC